MEIYDFTDISLYSVVLFVASFSLLVENSVFFIKTFTRGRVRKQEMDESGEIVKVPYDWKVPLISLCCGVVFAFSFDSHYFTWMPFNAIHPVLSRVFTGIMMGRIAGGGHDAIERLTQLFIGLIGRVRKKY